MISPEGKPIQVNAGALHAAAAQNAVGRKFLSWLFTMIWYCQEFSISSISFFLLLLTIKFMKTACFFISNINFPWYLHISNNMSTSVYSNNWNESFTEFLGKTVTVMSPEGKPVQINASALQAASSQNAAGRLFIIK